MAVDRFKLLLHGEKVVRAHTVSAKFINWSRWQRHWGDKMVHGVGAWWPSHQQPPA